MGEIGQINGIQWNTLLCTFISESKCILISSFYLKLNS